MPRAPKADQLSILPADPAPPGTYRVGAASGDAVRIDPPAVAVAETQDALIERLAQNPKVSVDKLERLMSLAQQAEDRRSRTAFNAAMSAAQAAMRPVAADADNPQTRSKYASYAALDRALRPIYTEHGFGLSFDTGEAPGELLIRVVLEVTHTGGWAKVYHLDMPADGKGAKGGDVMTRTHATGSAVTYGMRYLLKMAFNVAIGREAPGQPFADDDGNGASPRVVGERPEGPPDPPAGYEDWRDDLALLVQDGCDWPTLSAAWDKSPEAFKVYAGTYQRAMVTGWKATAQQP